MLVPAQTVRDMPALAERFVAAFPKLDAEGRKVAIGLYRLLALGEPVPIVEIAKRSGVPQGRVDALLRAWPGVYREQDRVIGFWGLTPRALSKHRFRTGDRVLYTWCAWDALFIPAILGTTAQVESEDALTGKPIRLTVAPARVEWAEPEGAVLSMLEPRVEMLDDVVTRLCHFIHFFESQESGAAWVGEHPGTGLMTLDAGFALGSRVFGALLGLPAA